MHRRDVLQLGVALGASSLLETLDDVEHAGPSREHYSTVTPDEQRRSIGNVVSLFGPVPFRSVPPRVGSAVGRVAREVGRE
jgi:hypothetical protein